MSTCRPVPVSSEVRVWRTSLEFFTKKTKAVLAKTLYREVSALELGDIEVSIVWFDVGAGEVPNRTLVEITSPTKATAGKVAEMLARITK